MQAISQAAPGFGISTPETWRVVTLADHLRRIVELLYPEPANLDRVNKLREVMGRKHATAHVSCFWFDKRSAVAPSIPDDIRAALAGISAEIETDFQKARQVEETASGARRRHSA